MKDFEFYSAPNNANLKFYKLHDLGLWKQPAEFQIKGSLASEFWILDCFHTF